MAVLLHRYSIWPKRDGVGGNHKRRENRENIQNPPAVAVPRPFPHYRSQIWRDWQYRIAEVVASARFRAPLWENHGDLSQNNGLAQTVRHTDETIMCPRPTQLAPTPHVKCTRVATNGAVFLGVVEAVEPLIL